MHRLSVLRDLTIQLVARDIKLRYRRTAMGLTWLFIFPLAQILVFNFIFTTVLPTKVGKYSAFVSIGVLVWTWFQSSLVMASTAITGNRDLVRRPGLPVSVLPFATVATNLVLLVVAVPAIIGLVLYGGGRIGATIIVLPLAIAVQFVLTLGIAYAVASLNVRFRDTQHLVPLALLLLFFLSPIFYDAASVPEAYRALYNLNPFVVLLDAYRAPLLHDTMPNALQLVELAAVAALVGLTGHLAFKRASRRFAEEI
jgi:lipopolysaccharide transport system permease protein